jgi:DNA-binding MarR family transcriptional regulator
MAKKATTSSETAKKRLIADRLHAAAIHLLRRLRRADLAAGLSGPQLSALSVIVYGGPLTLGELAAAEQVRPPTMTRIVRDLEAARLIRRDADKNDRRVARVQASPAGARLLKQGRNRRVLLLAQWISTLSDLEYEAIEEAVAILEKFPHHPLR